MAMTTGLPASGQSFSKYQSAITDLSLSLLPPTRCFRSRNGSGVCDVISFKYPDYIKDDTIKRDYLCEASVYFYRPVLLPNKL